MLSRKEFLRELAARAQQFKSIEIKDTNFEGSSPPSVFIGHHNYPNVFAGPMLSQEKDSVTYDTPENG